MRHAQVALGATFDLIVMTDTVEGSTAGEFVLTDVANLVPGVLRTSITKIDGSTFDLGDDELGESTWCTWGCVPPGPAGWIHRIEYANMAGALPTDLVLSVRGFQPGDTQPSSFGGEPGYSDCDNVLHALAGLEPELQTGSGASVSFRWSRDQSHATRRASCGHGRAACTTDGSPAEHPESLQPSDNDHVLVGIPLCQRAEFTIYDIAGRRGES